MDINLICVGKIKEDYLNGAIAEYTKRIKPFSNLKIIEVKEINNYDEARNIIEEGKLILDSIKASDYVITLEIEGKELSSVELSEMIRNHYTYNSTTLTFVIGGSNGLSREVKDRSNYKKLHHPMYKNGVIA